MADLLVNALPADATNPVPIIHPYNTSRNCQSRVANTCINVSDFIFLNKIFHKSNKAIQKKHL